MGRTGVSDQVTFGRESFRGLKWVREEEEREVSHRWEKIPIGG